MINCSRSSLLSEYLIMEVLDLTSID